MTSSLKDLQVDVRDHMTQRFASHGMARERDDEYMWPLADGFRGWFNPTLLSRPHLSIIQVTPQVGVRSAAIEDVARRLGGDGAQRPWLPTVVTQLSRLLPDRGVWLLTLGFARGEPVEPVAREILDAFEQCGRPWIEARATLPAMRDELAALKGIHDSPVVMPRRLAAHLLCGDLDAAEADLSAAQREAHKDTYKPERFRALVATWTARLPGVAAAVLDQRV